MKFENIPGALWQLRKLRYIRFHTLRPRQHGRHFADDTFKRIFLNENVIIAIKISLKFVPKGLINNIPALVQATSHYLKQWWLIYWRIYAPLGLNELMTYISVQYYQIQILWPNMKSFSLIPLRKNQLWALTVSSRLPLFELTLYSWWSKRRAVT